MNTIWIDIGICVGILLGVAALVPEGKRAGIRAAIADVFGPIIGWLMVIAIVSAAGYGLLWLAFKLIHHLWQATA
jgi:hypothetical protein